MIARGALCAAFFIGGIAVSFGYIFATMPVNAWFAIRFTGFPGADCRMMFIPEPAEKAWAKYRQPVLHVTDCNNMSINRHLPGSVYIEPVIKDDAGKDA